MKGARIYLVDDDTGIRRSLKKLLEHARFQVVAYESSSAFLSEYRPTANACILMDIVLPGSNGLDVLDRLMQMPRANPVIVITGQANVPMATRALESGAFAFIEKPFRSPELLGRIESAIDQDRRARHIYQRQEELRQQFLRLTSRESQVLDRVVAGRMTKQIALELGISERTVETHRRNIMWKLDIDSLAELIAMAIENREARFFDRSAGRDYPLFGSLRPWRASQHQPDSN